MKRYPPVADLRHLTASQRVLADLMLEKLSSEAFGGEEGLALWCQHFSDADVTEIVSNANDHNSYLIQPMSIVERQLCLLLRACRFSPGSFDKHFAATMASKTNVGANAGITPKQATCLRMLIMKYREQISRHIPALQHYAKSAPIQISGSTIAVACTVETLNEFARLERLGGMRYHGGHDQIQASPEAEKRPRTPQDDGADQGRP